MAENQVYLIKSGSNSFVEETEAVVGISGGKVGIGTTHPQVFFHVTGDAQIDGDLTVKGDLTTVNSTTIQVDDKNIELGVGSTADAAADGGGITLHAGTNNNKTFNWLDATDAWTSSEHLYLADGKHFSADELRALDNNGLKLADATTSGVLIKGGKVGIHKAAPVYDLDVDGSGNFASLYVDGNAVLTGEGSIFGKWEDGNAQGEIYYTGGNVGVGADNPEHSFHVSGNAAVDGNFIVNGTSGNLNVEELNLSGDYVHVNYLNGALTDGRGGLQVHHTNGTGKLEYTSSTTGWQFNKKLEVLGDVNVQNNLTIGGLISNNASVESNFTVGNNLTVSGNFEVKGTTTTVNTQTVTIEDHNLVIASNTGYNQLTEEYPNAGGGYAGLFWGTGDAGKASPVSLTYQHNKGFNFTGAGVGIGVENPAYDLDVAGTGNFSSAVQAPSILQNGNTVVDQGDIGSEPNQIPLNKDLGSLAYMNAPQIEDINVDTLELREIAAEMSETAVDVFVYDTRKDSDGGAWRHRTSHTSWYNEPLNTATRGGRREFPAVAVIVAEANKVTIYDGDDPDLNMWMIWEQSGALSWASTVITTRITIASLNGKFVWGTDQRGGGIADFVKDEIEIYHGAIHYELVDKKIASRSSSSFVLGNGYSVVNTSVNDVAMTVLPNAPIDSDTGLPIPTIAVATDGGVSVIKDDGNVVDIVSDNLNAEIPLEVNFRGRLLYMLLGSPENISNSWNSVSTIYIPDDDVSTTYRSPGDYVAQYFRYNGLPATEPGNSGHDMLVPINSQTHLPLNQRSQAINVLGTDHLYIAGEGSEDKAGGVAAISENLTNPKNGLLAYTTSRYNTGWMPGDIKLAALSDTKIEKVGVDEGAELIANNDFSSTINENDGVGWDLVTGTQSIVGGVLTIQPAAYGGVEQIINVLPNKKYIFNVVVHATTTGTARIYLGDSSSQGAYYNEANLTVGAYNFEFTTSSDTVLKIKLATTSEFSSNVSFSSTSLKQTGELITNGTFDNGIEGWTKGADSTFDPSTGQAVVGGTYAGGGYIYQSLNLIVGKKYTVSFDLISNTNGNAKVYVGPTTNGINTSELTNHSFTFVFASGSIVLQAGVDGEAIFDNVSVRLAEDDRSVNNNGLQVFGEIDKTPVATGADLVAYSGFSADNYLMQPYNSDLDFGTGDFSIMAWIKDFAINNDYQRIFSRGIDGYTGVEWDLYFHATESPHFKFRYYINGSSMGDTSFAEISSMYTDSWNQIVLSRKDDLVQLHINGSKVYSKPFQFGPADLTNTSASLYVGNRFTPSDSSSFNGSIALARISATAPADEQIAKIYRDEKPLFQDGAQATLYGTSDAVTALAYDDSENLLHVGTASGRSSFNGLKRVDNTTTAVSTAISATEGLVIEQ